MNFKILLLCLVSIFSQTCVSAKSTIGLQAGTTFSDPFICEFFHVAVRKYYSNNKTLLSKNFIGFEKDQKGGQCYEKRAIYPSHDTLINVTFGTLLYRHNLLYIEGLMVFLFQPISLKAKEPYCSACIAEDERCSTSCLIDKEFALKQKIYNILPTITFGRKLKVLNRSLKISVGGFFGMGFLRSQEIQANLIPIYGFCVNFDYKISKKFLLSAGAIFMPARIIEKDLSNVSDDVIYFYRTKEPDKLKIPSSWNMYAGFKYMF
jgi:hypothetical protein